MGNVDSRSSFQSGYMCFQTDKPYYQPGEAITGKVYLRVMVPLDAKCIEINIKGKEKGSWTDRVTKSTQNEDGSVNYEQEDVKRKAHRVIIDYKAPVFSFANGSCLPGDYIIPV